LAGAHDQRALGIGGKPGAVNQAARYQDDRAHDRQRDEKNAASEQQRWHQEVQESEQQRSAAEGLAEPQGLVFVAMQRVEIVEVVEVATEQKNNDYGAREEGEDPEEKSALVQRGVNAKAKPDAAQKRQRDQQRIQNNQEKCFRRKVLAENSNHVLVESNS